MFVDEIKIQVIAGKGGDGCTSFRREKYIAMGGPDGGNGGRGANIVFRADKNLKTLIDLRYNKIIKGDKGVNGKGSSRNGKNAEDIIIKVPEGTIITDVDTELVVADLVKDGQEIIVAYGGRGGKGNKAFATHYDTAPKISEYGEPGEERIIKCELKLLADVGLVGMPSVGKSSILDLISAAKPKIGSYHFTTISPNLGVVTTKDNYVYTIADLPGLILGASEGLGLGDKFLRHTMRTKVIAHVIDMGASEGRNPIDDYEIIHQELANYSSKLVDKEQVVIANKMDLENANENLVKFKEKYPKLEVIPVSVTLKQNIALLVEELGMICQNTKAAILIDEKDMESHVIYQFKNEKPYTISNDQGIWIIKGTEIERIFKMTKFDNDEAVKRFARKLEKMGIEDELEALGAKRGDDVQIMGYIFSFKE